jgi:hypothetical protein
MNGVSETIVDTERPGEGAMQASSSQPAPEPEPRKGIVTDGAV